MALDPDEQYSPEQQVMQLDRHTRRVMLAKTGARILGITVALMAAYFAAPIGQDGDALGFTVLVLGLVAFVGLFVFQIERIVNSPAPQLRAAEALATVVPLIIVIFATAYVAMSDSDGAAFSEPITKVDGLYFTVTVLATVGFGDITGVSEAARLLVTVQMVVDLLIVGVLVKVLLGATRVGMERRRAEAARRSSAPPGASPDGTPAHPEPPAVPPPAGG